MNILIIGSGGREHVLANAYAKSKKVKKVFVAPGNPFIEFANRKAKIIPDTTTTNFEKIVSEIKKNKIDFVDVASDDPLAEGFVDKLSELGIRAFGPTKSASEIEWSKEWSRNFMKKHKLPAPKFKVFKNKKDAVSFINKSLENSFFVKASGLALGKGAIRADSKMKAITAVNEMEKFGKAGETFLIEELLVGEEFSLFAVCDGSNYKILGSAQDHKTVYNADQGPNTGGMGCVSSPSIVSKNILKNVEKNILKPFMIGMKKEGRPYIGILYLGGMITRSTGSGQAGVKIIEFNARWGDPEAEVLLPSIQTEYLTIVENALSGTIKNLKIKTDHLKRISIAGCSLGYPGDYSKVKGKEILGITKAAILPSVNIYGAGISKIQNKFTASGGRVFHLTAEGRTIIQARVRAYAAISMISIEGNNLHFRTDIGWRDVERMLDSSNNSVE